MFRGTHDINDTVTIILLTHNQSTGASADADSLPTYRIYEAGTETPVATGSYAKFDDSNTVGVYFVVLTLSNSTYDAGKQYTILSAATVSTVAYNSCDMFQTNKASAIEITVSSSSTTTSVNVTVPTGIDDTHLDNAVVIQQTTGRSRVYSRVMAVSGTGPYNLTLSPALVETPQVGDILLLGPQYVNTSVI